jgi:hypothetical protein
MTLGFDRLIGNLTRVTAMREQAGPALVAVDDDPPLVKHLDEKQRGALADSVQPRDIHVASNRLSQPPSKRTRGTGGVFPEVDQQVEIRGRFGVPAGHRPVEDSKPDVWLGAQRPAERGQDGPVSTQVLALARRELQPSLPRAAAPDRSPADGPTKRPLVGTEFGRDDWQRASHDK